MAPQLIPAGALVTVPLPVPVLLSVSTKVGVKVAVTVVAAEIVRVQVPVPVQPPPLQPLKIEPVAGAAVSVTAVPLAYGAEQVAPQVIPMGALVTVPLPAPVLLTVSVAVTATPVPVATRGMISPSAAKLTFTEAVADVVGLKRTVTAWVAPSPTRLNVLPEKMLKGADVDIVPDTVPPAVFDTVKT